MSLLLNNCSFMPYLLILFILLSYSTNHRKIATQIYHAINLEPPCYSFFLELSKTQVDHLVIDRSKNTTIIIAQPYLLSVPQ